MASGRRPCASSSHFALKTRPSSARAGRRWLGLDGHLSSVSPAHRRDSVQLRERPPVHLQIPPRGRPLQGLRSLCAHRTHSAEAGLQAGPGRAFADLPTCSDVPCRCTRRSIRTCSGRHLGFPSIPMRVGHCCRLLRRAVRFRPGSVHQLRRRQRGEGGAAAGASRVARGLCSRLQVGVPATSEDHHRAIGAHGHPQDVRRAEVAHRASSST